MALPPTHREKEREKERERKPHIPELRSRTSELHQSQVKTCRFQAQLSSMRAFSRLQWGEPLAPGRGAWGVALLPRMQPARRGATGDK